MVTEPGTRIRRTTETEVLPPANDAKPTNFYDRDFWEVIADIGAQKLWKDHLARVYRADDRWERGAALENNKLTDSFNEETIRRNWGGGRYLIWLYGPPEGRKVVMAPFKLELEGIAKNGLVQAPAQSGGSLETELLRELLQELRAARGGNLSQDAMKNALDIHAMAMRSAFDVIRPVQPQAPQGDDLTKTILAALIPAMISRFTNPADPIEGFGKMIEAVRTVSSLAGSGGKEAKPDVVNTIISNLPALGDRFVSGLKEYRLSMEAQRDAIAMQGKTITVEPNRVPPTAAAEISSQAPPASPPAEPAAAPPSHEVPKEVVTVMFDQIIFHKIVERIEDPETTGADLYDFLEITVPSYIPQLGAASREQIVEFFRGNEILRKVADHPRLPKMIDEFIQAAKEAKE